MRTPRSADLHQRVCRELHCLAEHKVRPCDFESGPRSRSELQAPNDLAVAAAAATAASAASTGGAATAAAAAAATVTASATT